MENLSPTEKLDFVLNYMSEIETPISNSALRTTLGWSNVTINEIFYKLKDERYIRQTESNNKEISWHEYIITFDGRLFIENGGYKAKFSLDSAYAEQQQLEINRLKTVDVNSLDNQNRLNLLTLWLAVGTGGLFLLELVKFLVSLYCSKNF